MNRVGLIISVVLVGCGCGGGAFAQPSREPHPLPSTFGLNHTFQDEWTRETQSREDARRLQRATRAAGLINAGKCDKALKLAQSANDHDMATRIGVVCATRS
jgi:hypothetical protein